MNPMALAPRRKFPWHSGRRPPLWLAMGTAIAVLVMAALLVFEYQQRNNLRNVAKLRSDSITAITFHSEREFLRLQRTLDLAVNGRKPYDLDELMLRYELMLSRLGILRDSANIEALITMPQYALVLPKVEKVMAELGRALESKPPRLSELAQPLQEFEEVGIELHDLTLAANSEMSRQLTIKEEDELRQNNLILSLSSAMLLFLLAGGVALIRRQISQEAAQAEQSRLLDSLRELNEHLEIKVQERTRDIHASMQAAQESATHAEHALALMEATLEATDSAIAVVDPEGKIASTNRHLSETFKLDSQELFTRSRPFGKNNVFRDTLTLQDGRVYSRVSHPQRVQGEVVGRVWSFLNITEQVQAENRIRTLSDALSVELDRSLQRNGLLNALLGAIPDMVWMKDMEGKFISCNAAFEKSMGATSRQIIGKTDFDFYAPEVADRFVQADQEALQSAQTSVKEHWQTDKETGAEALIEVTKVPVRDSTGQLIGVLGIARDVTKLRTLLDDLRKAKEEALQASETKSLFLANMSHEIRTPMNAVIGMANLALDTELNIRQHNYLSKIKTASESLLNIINDILDFSKIEAGKLLIENAPFDLEGVFDMLSGLMALRAERQGIELTYKVGSNIPSVLIGDSLRVGQILSNLVSNALKFSAGGNVVLNVEVVSLDARDVELQFSVSDQGIGLNAEQVSKLFRPFTQADASTTRRYGGTGLGLAICSNLVRLLDGRIWVESEIGQGSTFFFTVRFRHGTERRQSEAQELANALRPHAGKAIVLVDDNDIARSTLEGMLKPLNMPVLAFADAAALLDCMQDPERPQALLFLIDWFMPGLDGIETIRRLRALYEGAAMDAPPMLLVTAHLYDDDLQKVDDVIDGLLGKPLSTRRLHAEISNALGLRPSRQLKSGLRKADGLDWSRLRPLDILLVEDVEVNREVMVELLASVGMAARLATNGAEAIEEVRRKTPDLVLMDCQMPVMDGYTATSKLRAMPQYTTLPIVALTAGAMVEDKRRCFAAGMNAYVTKPVRLDVLYEQLLLCMPDKAAKAARPPVLRPNQLAQASDLPAFPGIDVPLGLAQVGGRPPMFLRVLKKFRDNQGASFAERFRQALDGADWQAAARIVHSLKGISRTLGADDLAQSAQHLETAIEGRDGGAIEGRLQDVLAHLHTVMAGLAGLEAWIVPAGGTAARGVTPETLAQLRRLGELLNASDTQALDLSRVLSQRLQRLRHASLWMEICACIENYEFPKASQALHRLLGEIDMQRADQPAEVSP
jgi:PAS domain S-box-containing protein